MELICVKLKDKGDEKHANFTKAQSTYSFELAVATDNFIRLSANCSRFVPSRVRETKMEPISSVPEILCHFKDQ
jgi:hypothetical protein